MSAHYVLEVFRAEDIVQYSEPKLCGRAKNFYVKVNFGGDAKKTQIQDGTRPEWNELLTISSEASSCNLTVELKQRLTFLRRTCIGSAEISPEELLSRNAHGEVRLELLDPSNARPSTPAGVVLLRLKSVTETERADIDINTAVERVDQSGIANPDRTERFDTVDGAVTLLSPQSDLAKSLATILAKMDVFVGFIDNLSTIHPFLSAAWQVTSSLYKAIRNQFETDQQFVDMVHMMEDIFNLISDAEIIRDKIESLERPICLFLQQSTECCAFIGQYVRRGFATRTLDTTSGPKIDAFMASFRDLKAALDSGIGLQTTFISARMSEKIDTILLRQELNASEMDASSRRRCLPGTRTEVLEEIMDWLFSHTDENILWLRGVAGSGKSTISMTIAEYCQEMCRLGAYLFFEREKSDPSSVIRTIACSLASFDQSIATCITEAVRKHSNITKLSITLQFTKLVNEPLQAVASLIQGPVIIILDALDECGTSHAREALVSILENEFQKLPHTFRFLITSRPEPDIYRALSSTSAPVHVIELDYASQSSRDDVHQYIDYEMQRVFKKEGLGLPSNWGQNITLLSSTANSLFVWASTAVKMVSTSDNPFDDFEDLLSYCSSEDSASRQNKELGLNSLYETLLRHSGIRWTNNRSRSRFVQVLSLILLSKIPLSVAAIGGILGFAERSSSRLIIERLQSVLVYTPSSSDAPVRLFHASFSDYLTAPECNKELWFIDPVAQRCFVATQCFDVMKKGLRFNVCDLESSFVRNTKVRGIKKCIENRIPLSLEHACRFWAEHLCDVPYSTDLAKKLTTFAEQYLLYWFEVLSLKKHFRYTASRALYDATSWSSNHPIDISSLLWDAYRLCNIFSLPMSESVPHIYLSALSLVKGTKPRPPCMKIFKGHTDWVNSVAFSPDGKRVVSGSHDRTIHVWDAESGQVVAGPFEGHTDRVNSVAFSPDGKRIVSGSHDRMIRVCDAESGQVVADSFEGHTNWVNSVTFSPDGKRVASGSYDRAIRMWDAESGQVVAGPFEGHTDWVYSVVFSPDGKCVLSGSRDRTIRLWDAESGQTLAGPFKGHTDDVNSIAFSPDGKRVVSGSHDRTIRVWDAESGQVVAGPFEGHTDRVYSVAFSPDGKCVVSGSRDGTICVWDAVSGRIVSGLFKGHANCVNSVAFSPDGKRIVSGSRDETIRVWDAESGQVVASPFEGHTRPINSVAFSPDGNCVASGSGDGTIGVWDAESSQVVAGPFKGHADAVNSVAFSLDGKCVVSGSHDGTIRLWDVESGQVFASPFKGHTDIVNSVAFAPDSKYIVSDSHYGTIRVWDVESGKVVAGPFDGHTGRVRSVTFSPDGKRVVSGSDDRTIRVWDVTCASAETTSLESEVRPDTDRHCAESPGSSFQVEMECEEKRTRTFLNELGFLYSWNMSDEGWLLGKNGELLLWIPEDMRGTLWAPSTIALLNCQFSTKLDFTGCKVGPGWYVRYRGGAKK